MEGVIDDQIRRHIERLNSVDTLSLTDEQLRLLSVLEAELRRRQLLTGDY